MSSSNEGTCHDVYITHIMLWLLLSVYCVGQIWPNLSPCDCTLKFLCGYAPKLLYPMLWIAESPQNGGWDSSQCWVLVFASLLTGFFQIQWSEFIHRSRHQHGPAARYMTGSLTRTVPEILRSRSCVCPPWAGENNSSGFCNDLPVSFLCL